MLSGRIILVGALSFMGAGFVSATEVADLDPEKVTADCRMEGEAEGLTGSDLEKFVMDCAITLLEEVDVSAGGKETAAY